MHPPDNSRNMFPCPELHPAHSSGLGLAVQRERERPMCNGQDDVGVKRHSLPQVDLARTQQAAVHVDLDEVLARNDPRAFVI